MKKNVTPKQYFSYNYSFFSFNISYTFTIRKQHLNISAIPDLFKFSDYDYEKRFLSILTLSMSLIALTSCNHDNDDNFRAFMSTATITGDSINGYYCYLDVGGIVISYDQALQNPDTLLYNSITTPIFLKTGPI